MSRAVLARLSACLASPFLMAAAAPVPPPTPTGFPFTNETLNYTVNWPSGLSLGEAHMTATRAKTADGKDDGWAFDLTLDAAVPAFGVADRYRATASPDLCSTTLDKDYTHGSRKSHERVDFDSHQRVAHRETVGGGKSDLSIPLCPHDALTFLYFARRELGQGRVPPFENVVFGAAYQVRFDYTGAQQVRVNDKSTEADRLIATLKGPASEISFEMFFARDAARTPLMIRVPLSLGMFSLELAH